jgi:hypothetical protein
MVWDAEIAEVGGWRRARQRAGSGRDNGEQRGESPEQSWGNGREV